MDPVGEETAVKKPSEADRIRDDARRYLVMTSQNFEAPVFVKSYGSTLVDTDGNEYTDLCASIGAANVGHRHPEVVKAICHFLADGLQRANLSANSAPSDPVNDLAKKLAEITPGFFEKKVFFIYTGGLAVEGAVKLVKKYAARRGEKARFAVFENDFHGRPIGVLPGHDRAEEHRLDFIEETDRWDRIPFPEWCGARHNCKDYAYNAIRKVRDDVYPHYTAFIPELVQGEGGIRPACFTCLPQIIRALREKGTLVIPDEVQTGFGRTGEMFASKLYGIEQEVDGVILGKSLSPELLGLSAVVIRANLNFEKKGYNSVTGPGMIPFIAAMAGIKVLESITRSEMNERIRTLAYAAHGGVGLMRRILFATAAERDRFLKALYKERIYAIGAGDAVEKSGGIYAVRFMPPLTIPVPQLEDACKRIIKLKERFSFIEE